MYVLRSKKNQSLYIGYSNNLRRRFKEHNDGKSISTRDRRPFELIYYEAYKAKPDARYRENNLKRFAKAWIELKKRINNSLG